MEPKKKKTQRKSPQRKNFEIEDGHLVQQTRMWHKLFLEHLAEFTAFDHSLDNAFAIAWLNKAGQLEGHPTDETIRDEISDKSQTLDEKIKELLVVIDDLEYYVSRAFPTDPAVLDDFDFPAFRKVKANYPGQLVILSFVANKVRQDYETELLAAGLPANWPDTLNLALDGMGVAELEQEYAKRLRIRGTRIRVRLFNELWDMHQLVKKAAAVVFRNNKVVAEQFA